MFERPNLCTGRLSILTLQRQAGALASPFSASELQFILSIEGFQHYRPTLNWASAPAASAINRGHCRQTAASLRRLHRPVAVRNDARPHPRRGRRKTTGRRFRSGRWPKRRKAHPSARPPDKTTRGPRLLSDSLVATWSLLVRAVYSSFSRRDAAGRRLRQPLLVFSWEGREQRQRSAFPVSSFYILFSEWRFSTVQRL
jgi:hypothetical protein